MTVQAAQSSRWDQLFEEIDAKRAYIGGDQSTSVTPNLPHVQLYNPGGSTKIVHMLQMWVQGDGGNELTISTGTTAMAVLGALPRNLNFGGPAPVGEVRTSAAALILAQIFIRAIFPYGSVLPIFEGWGFQLGAGEGITVMNPNADGTIRAWFQCKG